jgi:uncharacterized coiled-coil protein SlyX
MKSQQAAIYQVRTWFFIALVLKVIFASISYWIKDPFWTGFILPIGVMIGYGFVGSRVRDRYDVYLTVAKFADSVYYLGFLFTVASIIVCLADIQSIGDNLTGMATRFAAAMISTAIGMAVRTLLVGFKPDTDDATKSVEEQAISAAGRLVHMFEETHSRLKNFHDQVLGTSKETLGVVKEEIEAISKHSLAATDAFFANATQRSNEAFDAMLKDARDASSELLVTIHGLKDQSQQTLERMEAHALDFGNLAQRRLEQTMFPDDLFANKLKPSIDTLAETTEGVNSSISVLAEDVKAAARSVGSSIRGLNAKTLVLEEALNAVGNIVDSQQRLLDAMNSQGDSLMKGVERVQQNQLDSLAGYHADLMTELKLNRQVSEKVMDNLQALNDKIERDNTAAALSQEIDDAFKAVGEITLRANEAFSESIKSTLMPLVQAIMDSTETHKGLASQVVDSQTALDQAHSHLDELVRKIDHVNRIEVLAPAVNEPVIQPEANTLIAVQDYQPSADVRPA